MKFPSGELDRDAEPVWLVPLHLFGIFFLVGNPLGIETEGQYLLSLSSLGGKTPLFERNPILLLDPGAKIGSEIF